MATLRILTARKRAMAKAALRKTAAVAGKAKAEAESAATPSEKEQDTAQQSAELPSRTATVIPEKAGQALRKNAIRSKAIQRHFAQKSLQQSATLAPAPLPKHTPARTPLRLTKSSVKNATQHTLRGAFRQLKAIVKLVVNKATKAVANSLVFLLCTGGTVLVFVLTIGIIAALFGSPMGVLFADESADPNAIPIASIVTETNADFAKTIDSIVAAHPQCDETVMHNEYENGHTWASYWPEVLAVFAVDANLNSNTDVIVIDEGKKAKLQGTFWQMHKVEYEVEQILVAATPPPSAAVGTTPQPSATPQPPQYRYVLHITVSSQTVAQLAAQKRFTADQISIVDELLSDSMRPMLLAMCGGLSGYLPEDGQLLWPLPGHSTLTTLFGETDAFGKPGHRGTDIAAPEGAAIVAAHAGTVLFSGWNDSYGNYVLLDSGAGVATRYAHMVATATAAGETVQAGQVIGYVGSTGDSTGNHLHFELEMNGVLVNPIDWVRP